MHRRQCPIFSNMHAMILIIITFDKKWVNEFVSWNPDDYGGLSTIRVNPSSVWTPEINVVNR